MTGKAVNVSYESRAKYMNHLSNTSNQFETVYGMWLT